MPLKPKTKDTQPMTCDRVGQIKNQRLGQNTIMKASDLPDQIPRVPTGVFILTYATGGGYPIHRMSRLKGKEGSGKSTNALNATKMAQDICWRCYNMAEYCTCSLPPIRQNVVYADLEGSLDSEWIDAIGIDPDRLYLPTCSDGSEYLDTLDSFLQADDCGLAIIDSVAMLLPRIEVDRAIGDAQIGSQAKLLTSGVIQLQNRLRKEFKRGHPCLIIAVNQVRWEVGLRFGNPESESGGQAFKHWFGLGIRSSKLAYTDEKYKDEDVRLIQKHGAIIDKEKMWVVSKTAEFLRARENIYANKDSTDILYKKTSILDDAVILKYAKQYGLVENNKIPGLFPDTRLEGDLKAEFRKNGPNYYQLHIDIVRKVKELYLQGGRRGGNCLPDMPDTDDIEQI